jgi:hypothetical protein
MSKFDFGGKTDEDLQVEIDALIPDEIVIDVAGSEPRACDRVMSNGEACPNFLPPGSDIQRRFCDAHRGGKKAVIGESGEPLPPTMQPPKPKVVTKKDSDSDKVEAGALSMLIFVPMLWMLIGDEVCPVALNAALPAIAKQLGELSRYHPGLKKVFAPGEGTGEAFVWVAMAIAVSPVILAVLTHHRIIKGDMAERLSAAADSIATLTASMA